MDKKKILVIDDEAGIRDLCGELLEREGYSTFFASDGREGAGRLAGDKFDLIILDIQMPLMDGFDTIRAIREKDKNVPVVVMTGFATVENAVRALKSGASDFIVKPFVLKDFLDTVKDNLEAGSRSVEISRLKMIETILELNKVIVSLTSLDLLLEKIAAIVNNIFQPESVAVYLADEFGNFILRKQIAKNRLRKKIPVCYGPEEMSGIFTGRKVHIEKAEGGKAVIPLSGKEKKLGFIKVEFAEGAGVKDEEMKFLEVFAIQAGIGIENANLLEVVKNSYLNSIRSLINSLEAKDACTKGHSEQVAYYACLIGRHLGLTEREMEIVRNASYLHDLGKLGIRDAVLLKPGSLDENEMAIVRKHPEITVKILEPLGLRKEEMDTCFYHHEKINGEGYPSGLKGDEIPFYAKILSVADAYSAMVSERPYRKGLAKKDAVSELQKWAGIQFDANIVDVFVKILEENGNEEGQND